ncbi:hypothetical protein FHT39_003972 [Mitsuaria sp. BK045]|uniref:DUF484 family protein n=1 Tax=unclassified Roseateles TaxID=2626991 RepID=UPI0016201729|nr:MULTISPECIES: DUF484 family protein [unclassified Roseateles]MBB3295292.1 hypothetical protein [Mitsuaria sp. BK041]MBB3364508.1 hypothetical protein [Mitsuaria sp. BK045]
MSGIEGITEQDIADYLANDPAFFERHAELLANVRISHPHGQHAVSLQERQAELLRDKIRGLEHKIIEMIRNGQENVAIADRLHRWTLALMLTRDDSQLPEVLLRELRHQFLIPQAGLRLWNVGAGHALAPFAAEVNPDVKTFVGSLNQPYCGINSGFEAARWLEDDVASLALVPLTAGAPAQPFGLLVLGSPDPTRYTAEMGTEFLSRVGEIASAALSRLLHADPHAAGHVDRQPD